MSNFSIENLTIEGLKVIHPFYIEDERGYFLKSVETEIFRSWGIELDIREDFESYSRQSVIRGMHFQIVNPQGKLVRAIKGEIHDIVVDLRKESKTFGEYEEVFLTEENHQSLWIPAGFAHGFEVLSEDAIMSYKCVGKYHKGSDTGICWNDETLELPWKTRNPIVSKKDQELMSFQEFKNQYGAL